MKTMYLNALRVSVFAVFVLAATQSFAQLHISTKHRTDAYFDTDTDKYVVTDERDDNTLFKFNKAMTMFDHTTATISSTYYIESKTYDEKTERYELEIKSDVGNHYTMIIDLKELNLRFLYKQKGVTYAVQHDIKSSWSDDDK
jgi:IMP dehydrogenase/GMP reductase